MSRDVASFPRLYNAVHGSSAMAEIQWIVYMVQMDCIYGADGAGSDSRVAPASATPEASNQP
jgi:hypothetical protein